MVRKRAAIRASLKHRQRNEDTGAMGERGAFRKGRARAALEKPTVRVQGRHAEGSDTMAT